MSLLIDILGLLALLAASLGALAFGALTLLEAILRDDFPVESDVEQTAPEDWRL